MKIDHRFLYTIVQIARIRKILLEMFDDDRDRVREWLISPQDYFLGKSPLDIVIEGQGDIIERFLEVRL